MTIFFCSQIQNKKYAHPIFLHFFKDVYEQDEDCEFSAAIVVKLNKHTCAKENEMSPCLSDVVFGQSFSLEIDLTHQQILIGFLFYIF